MKVLKGFYDRKTYMVLGIILYMEKDILVMDEETYLAINGVGRQCIGDAALHKNIPEGRIRDKILLRQMERDHKIIEERDRLRGEYWECVELGEIRPLNRIERLIMIAQGHIDNEATQAARRILVKYDINWNL